MMDYKLPFLLLVFGVAVAGILPFAISQSVTEPSMEIDMLAGQTQNPFRIQDEFDQDVFRVNVDGTIFPSPILYNELTVTTAYFDEFINELI